MARPEKHTVDYFPHDATANDGVTLTILQNQFGNDGYSFWFKLLERLCSTDYHIIDCRNKARWQFLLAKTLVKEDIATRILDTLSSLEAIDPDLWGSKIIWCQKLVDRIADVYTNRNKLPPYKPSFYNGELVYESVSTTDNKVSTTDKPVSTDPSTQKKLKETKLNKTKGNNKQYLVSLEEYKLSLKTEFPELDVDSELLKCNMWWSEGKRKMSRPKMAYHNWMIKAMEFKRNGNGKHIGNNESDKTTNSEKYTGGKYGGLINR